MVYLYASPFRRAHLFLGWEKPSNFKKFYKRAVKVRQTMEALGNEE
jgi:hypothetical protein